MPEIEVVWPPAPADERAGLSGGEALTANQAVALPLPECRNRFYGFSRQNGMQDRKRVKRRKRKTQQEQQFPQFFKPANDKEFEQLIAEISEAERRVFGKREEEETDPKVDQIIR